MKNTNFKTWAKAAGIRALKTFAQTAVALIGTTAVISDVDWITVVSGSALAAVLSILTSIAGLPECTDGKEELIEDPDIADEEIIDTTEADAGIQGNIIPAEKEGE